MFQDNVTLAIIPDNTWRSEYTYLHLRYFQRLLNPSVKVVSFPNVDAALGACETDYLFVFRAGALPYASGFFQSLGIKEVEEALFIGKILLHSDYAMLEDSMLLVNMQRWKDYGCPKFNSKVRQGPTFYMSIGVADDPRRPLQIVKESDEQIFVDNDCSSNGGEFIVLELNERGMCESFGQYCDTDDYYEFSTETPYHELITETRFEKLYLPEVRSRVFAIDTDDLSAAKQTTVGIVVAPAIGLKALTLAEHFKAKTIVVYSRSQPALDLQKLIFSVTQKTLYSDIVDQFFEDTGVLVEAGWEEDEYAIITPLEGVQVEYVLVDAFSYEMDRFIKKLDFQSSMVFDFSDVYTHPHEYYKRTFAQVDGLFTQLYSYLKSRTGPTHLFGLSPNFEPLHENLVNTSSESFEMDPTYDPTQDEELTQDMLDEAEEAEARGEVYVLKADPAPVFRPEDIPEITAPAVSKPIIAPLKVVEQIVEPIPDPIVQPIPEPVEPPIPEPVEPPKEQEMKLQELHQAKKSEKKDDDKPSDKDQEKRLDTVAEEHGFEKSHEDDKVNGEKVHYVKFTKTEEYEDLEYSASLEYLYNPETGSWKFMAGKVDSDKRIEFHNGEDEKSLIKHIERKTKFNPKTALQYF